MVDDQRYPVDDITMPTACELHVRAKNISIHVAYGSALPLNPCTTIHGRPMPPGYTSVTVEQIVENNEDLELDFVGGDGEKTLGDALHGVVLYMAQGRHQTYCKHNGSRADRLPISAASLTTVPTTSSLTTVSTGAKGHEYSNSSSTGKMKEKSIIPPSGLTLKEEAEHGRKKINLREDS
jgi:hypothetical protein